MQPRRRLVQQLVLPVVFSISVVSASCAHLGGGSPSSTSSEGVRLTIRDHQCMQIQETTDSKKDADLSIDLEITNPSPVPVVVNLGAMQVVDSEGGDMKRRGIRQRRPLEVAAGGNQSFTMHFVGAHAHCCSSRLALNPTGVTVGERALAVTPISFVPSCLF
jgi:hypothetical protein